MTDSINKATVGDVRSMLSDAVSQGWVVDFDLDDNYVYIEKYMPEMERYKTFKHSFTRTETSVMIDEDGVEVIRTTDYKDVMESEDMPVTRSFLTKMLDKHFGGSKTKDSHIVKQFGTEGEPMYAIEPLYIAPGEVDGHGDTMVEKDIESMVSSLNKANEEDRLQSGLFHKHKTDTWQLEKAWVNPVECTIGDQLVPAGQPIAKTLFTNAKAFEMRVNGEISGLSIGARYKESVDLTKDLSSIQSKPEATRQLVGVHFDWDHPELTYTSPSQGGAASLKNDAYQLSKAKKAKVEDLDDEQAAILKEIGEEFISLEKHLGADNDKTPSSSSEDVDGEETLNITKGTDDTMSDQTLERIAQLEKALAVSEATNSLTGYSFDAEVNKAVAGAIAKLETAEDKDAITKAFDVLVARSEEAVEKAKKAAPTEGDDLAKSLSEEVGEGGESEEVVEKSLWERAREAQDKMQGVK